MYSISQDLSISLDPKFLYTDGKDCMKCGAINVAYRVKGGFRCPLCGTKFTKAGYVKRVAPKH